MSSSNTSINSPKKKRKTNIKSNASDSMSQFSDDSLDSSLTSYSSISEESNLKSNFLSSLTKEELDRYESFRRSTFSQTEIKKLILNSIGQSVNPNFIIVVSSLAKVFSAELIMEACKIQKKKRNPNLTVQTIDEAFRNLSKRMPNIKQKKKWIFK